MPRKYTFESDADEQVPLDSQPHSQHSPAPQQRQYVQDNEPYYDEPFSQSTHPQHPQQQPMYDPASPPRHAHRPGAHPDSAYSQMSSRRGYASPDMSGYDVVSPVSPPHPPPHRDISAQYGRPTAAYSGQMPTSNVTPGADNFSEAAAGGVAGIAYNVADQNARESGYSSQPYPSRQHYAAGGWNGDRNSGSSMQGLGAAAIPPGSSTPGVRTPSRSPHSTANEVYTDDPYQGYSTHNPNLGFVNPSEIEDDGDEGLEYSRTRGARTSMLSLGGYSTRSSRSGGHGRGVVPPAAAGAAGVGVAAAGGAAATAALASEASRKTRVSPGGTRYNAVGSGPAGAGDSEAAAATAAAATAAEKSEWLARQNSSSRRCKWIVIGGLALLIAAGIVCGIVFGVVLKNNNGSGSKSSSTKTASGDTSANGDLDSNSAEIKALLNNKNLHKVFPGIDYTPINTQYPACLSSPPSQNNITRDVAVLSQLSNTIRLYGTDCNQTQMTIHAIRQLKLQDTVKIWMGVWQDNNKTTNARQLAQMWEVLDAYGSEPFKGVIVANEILFREQMTSSELGTLLSSVRTNMTAMNISLPVATSDLGTKWDSTLAQASDYIMANIHPFFGGINAKGAADWTWSFWDNNNAQFFKTDAAKNVISETGWPSQGGTDCGSGSTLTSCPDAAVAGIEQLNTFMADWVCEALTNGTQYFWFEAFDEPWKSSFNSGNQNWEDHWGLMDVNRNLKTGVQIPDCGGKTAA